MSKQRVMVICLDAYDAAISDRLISEGKLQGLARLKRDSARFELEHGEGGKARYTGLTWEHFSAGQTPDSTGKWSVISFDPTNYRATQSHASVKPFLGDTDAKTVVFDAPYFKLEAMENGVGVVGWGGHDTGCTLKSQPDGLLAEIDAKFGPQPDIAGLNRMLYPIADDIVALGETLVASVKRRTDISEWLLTERFPDWEVAVIGVGEPHDVIELMYHGVDPDHHLKDFASVAPARAGVEAVYEAVSQSIERLQASFPDAAIVAFTMHGMGENDTDLPTMLLLPELMYRVQFNRPLFDAREDWRGNDAPALRAGEDWNAAVIGAMTHPLSERARDKGVRLVSKAARKIVGDSFAERLTASDTPEDTDYAFGVEWMPSEQYKRYWSSMEAFGVPAYFDGRIRVNLKGRERDGIVSLEAYGDTLDRIEQVLRDCRDIKTGKPIVKEITRPGENDPLNLCNTQADIKIIWNGSPIGFRHPRYGDIGPGPVRRAGGHSGGFGALYVSADDVAPGDYGVHSSFDVAPTIIDLMDAVRPNRMDGQSVFETAPDARKALADQD